MAESVVLPLLVEAAKPMCEALGNRMLEEINLILEFKTELKKLLDKIQLIASIVLNMTDGGKLSVELWLRKVIRVIHNAEDLLDVLAYEKQRAVLMRKRPITGKIRVVFWPLERVYFRRKIGKWITVIDSYIEEALKEAQTIVQLRTLAATSATNAMIGDGAAPNDSLQQLRRNFDMSLFVGRDSDVDTVVENLCNPSQDCKTSNSRLSVAAIVGFGGIGKTLLAKNVCENEKIRNHFSESIWIASDSKDFNIERILNEMVKSFGSGSNEDASSETSIRKLQECLGRKRYLLVLDDVWNTHQQMWDTMRSALERIGGSMDSMVLATTRSVVVANTMQASSVHHLSLLSPEDSWSLFKKIAFAGWTDGNVFAFEACGREIVKKCGGVPLAIKSIGGLLHRKINLSDWKIIEKSELWKIPDDETGILPSLKLSYNHLSSSFLKKCFSLCAIWPKRTWFEKFELEERWMALGLIQRSNNENMTIEDISDEYFNELLSISFLLVYKRNELGDASMYTLHDLVYDLARLVASHECLHLESGKKMDNNVHDIQHVTVYGHGETTSDFTDKLVSKNIRTLQILEGLPKEFWAHMKYLRVLSLERLGLEEVPESISRLKCLKYLDLASNPIKELPKCIMGLYNLQSLILYKCEPLSETPEGLSNLVNLRHLGLSFYFRPAKGMFQQMSQLQTLPPLRTSEGGFQISELGCLHHIMGNLEIKGLELVKSKLDAEMANLSMKSRVEQLRLIWDKDDNRIYHEEVLQGLNPNPNLKLLLIKGYAGDKFPSWLLRMDVAQGNNHANAGALCNLIKIRLIDCGRCQQLPTLGHLPSLRILEITNMDSMKHISQEFYCGADLSLRNDIKTANIVSSSGLKSIVYFPKLEKLRLCGLPNLVEWCQPSSESWTGFPSLEVLEIKDCPQLRSTPNRFPALKQLIIKNMTSSQPLLNFLTNESSSRASLKKLHIKGVVELTHLPEDLAECTSLQILTIIRFPNLTCLPQSLSKLLSLEVLEIMWCHNLVSLPSLSNLGLLRELFIFKNDSLTSSPEGLQNCKSLEKLWVYCCPKIETLPDLTGLSRLSNLCIRSMTKMISQPPDWVYSLPCLRVLHIGSYSKLKEFPDISFLLNINSVECLYVYGWERLQSLPEQLRDFTTLQQLAICNFDDLEYLPDWLGNLSSLRALGLRRCKKLKKLPSEEAMKRLTKLNYLRIGECPELEEAIKINGTEHHKISPQIEVECINSTD